MQTMSFFGNKKAFGVLKINLFYTYEMEHACVRGVLSLFYMLLSAPLYTLNFLP